MARTGKILSPPIPTLNDFKSGYNVLKRNFNDSNLKSAAPDNRETLESKQETLDLLLEDSIPTLNEGDLNFSIILKLSEILNESSRRGILPDPKLVTKLLEAIFKNNPNVKGLDAAELILGPLRMQFPSSILSEWLLLFVEHSIQLDIASRTKLYISKFAEMDPKTFSKIIGLFNERSNFVEVVGFYEVHADIVIKDRKTLQNISVAYASLGLINEAFRLMQSREAEILDEKGLDLMITKLLRFTSVQETINFIQSKKLGKLSDLVITNWIELNLKSMRWRDQKRKSAVILQIIENILESPSPPIPKFYRVVLDKLSPRGYPVLVQKICKLVENDVLLLHLLGPSLISAYIYLGKLDKATLYYEKLSSRPLSERKRIIEAHLFKNNLDLAISVYNSTPTWASPTIIRIFLVYFVKIKNPDMGEQFYSRALEDGLVPNSRIYEVLLELFVDSPEQNQSIWNELTERGISIGPHMARHRIAHFLRFSKMNEAQELLSKSSSLWKSTYTLLAVYFKNIGDPRNVSRVFRLMSENGMKPLDCKSHTIQMNSWSQVGNTYRFQRQVREMFEDIYKSDNPYTYLNVLGLKAIVSGFLRAGKWKRAARWMLAMKQLGYGISNLKRAAARKYFARKQIELDMGIVPPALSSIPEFQQKWARASANDFDPIIESVSDGRDPEIESWFEYSSNGYFTSPNDLHTKDEVFELSDDVKAIEKLVSEK